MHSPEYIICVSDYVFATQVHDHTCNSRSLGPSGDGRGRGHWGSLLARVRVKEGEVSDEGAAVSHGETHRGGEVFAGRTATSW